MFAKTIDRYLCLSVTDCKRLGFFKPSVVATGVVKWTQGGDEVASIRLTTNTGSIPCATLSYMHKGVRVETNVTLRFKPSNLNNGTGYYYFVCPVTGLSCRKLYLVEGRFVGRQAFRPLYEKQTETRTARRGTMAFLSTYYRIEEMEAEKYRRFTYRGKPTPFGRRYDKLNERLGLLGRDVKKNMSAGRFAL